jgi:hypothetical protein
MKFLSQEFLDKGKELGSGMPDRPQASIVMQFVVTGGPGGDISYWQQWDTGHLAESKLGEAPDSEVTLTSSYADSTAISKGELNAQSAFMTGKVRATGNMAKLMSLMPLTTAPDYKEWEESIRKLDVEY